MSFISFMTIPLMMAASAAGLSEQNYRPMSDAAIGPIRLTPQSASEVAAQCDARLAAIARLRGQLEAMPVSTAPSALLDAYDDLYNLSMTTAYTEAAVLKDTHPEVAIRKAGEACVQRAGAAMVDISMSRPIYERLARVGASDLSGDARYMVDRQLAAYRRMGVDKDADTRKRIGELQNAILTSSMTFMSNIAEDDRTVSVRPDRLNGMPADWLAAHPADADRMVRIPLATPSTMPVLRYARDADVRKQVYHAMSNQAYPANVAVLDSIVADRAELARLLGLPDFATLDLSSRMVETPTRARAFLDQVDAAARPVGQAEVARLVARLKKDSPSLTQLDPWSSAYATGLVRTEDFSVDPGEVREYFAFDKVQAGILQLTQDLFGVQIRPWATDVWHPDVEAFEMVEDGQVIGRFFLDMHPRADKFTHAMMAPLRIGIRDRMLPAAVLVTNFPKGKMEHGDVVTYLHEFGHLIHWIFAGRQVFAAQNAMELEGDVVEAPSQLLEEWVWDYDTLRRFATNDAGDAIPATLVEKMNASRRFGEGLSTSRQLGFAAASLELYSAGATGDLKSRYDAGYNRYSLIAEPNTAHSYAAFGHLTGYGASYYTYQWSKALSSDLLGEFRANGLRDRATAQRYRADILAAGGSRSMNVSARQFLGRDWSIDAYRAELASMP